MWLFCIVVCTQLIPLWVTLGDLFFTLRYSIYPEGRCILHTICSVYKHPTPWKANTFKYTSPHWTEHAGSSDSTSYHKGAMATDRCRGGRKEGKTSDKLGSRAGSLKAAGHAGTHEPTRTSTVSSTTGLHLGHTFNTFQGEWQRSGSWQLLMEERAVTCASARQRRSRKQLNVCRVSNEAASKSGCFYGELQNRKRNKPVRETPLEEVVIVVAEDTKW